MIVSQTHQFINTEVLPVTTVKWRCAKHYILATRMGSPRLGGASAGDKWMDGAADQAERTGSPAKRRCCRPLVVRTQAPPPRLCGWLRNEARARNPESGSADRAVRTSSPAIGRCCGPSECAARRQTSVQMQRRERERKRLRGPDRAVSGTAPDRAVSGIAPDRAVSGTARKSGTTCEETRVSRRTVTAREGATLTDEPVTSDCRDVEVVSVGLRSEATHLLSESDLTLKWVLEIARNMQQLDTSTFSVESVSVSNRKAEGCYRCGGKNHLPWECRRRFKSDAECHNCGRKGHIARVCRSKGAPPKTLRKPGSGWEAEAKWVQTDRDSDSADDSLEDAMVYKIKDSEACTITVQLHINGTPLTMEVDTGAAVSILISALTQKQLFPKASLQQTSIKLIIRTYTDEATPVLGEITVEVTYQENTHALILYVVQGNGPALLGRSWLQHICLDWRSLGIATVQKFLKELHQSHSGMVWMKAVAQSYVWWPGLDGDLETFVRSCQKCQSCHSMPAMAPLHPWLWPSLPWQRIHVDYAGPVDGRMLLVIVDADLGVAVSQKQARQKKNHDLHSHSRDFHVGERVLVRNMRPIVEHRGPLSYLVQVANGVVWRRHVDHLRQTIDSPQEEEETAVPDTNVDDSRMPPSSLSDEDQSSSLPAVTLSLLMTYNQTPLKFQAKSLLWLLILLRVLHHLDVTLSVSADRRNDFMNCTYEF